MNEHICFVLESHALVKDDSRLRHGKAVFTGHCDPAHALEPLSHQHQHQRRQRNSLFLFRLSPWAQAQMTSRNFATRRRDARWLLSYQKRRQYRNAMCTNAPAFESRSFINVMSLPRYTLSCYCTTLNTQQLLHAAKLHGAGPLNS
jgi:hypothetical protein